MLAVVQAAAGDKFWATTGPFAYHWVAVGASGVDRKQCGLAEKSEVSTNYDGPEQHQFLQLVSSKITMAYECVVLADCPGALVELCGISTLERLLRTLQRW